MKMTEYDKLLKGRLQELYKMTKVTFEDMEGHFHLSNPQLYKMKAGDRKTSRSVVEKLGSFFYLTIEQLEDRSFRIPKILNVTDELNALRKKKEGAKVTRFIMERLYPTDLFNQPVTAREVRAECNLHDNKYKIKEVSNSLEYLARNDYLISRKGKMIKINGTKGNRMINYYSRNKKNANPQLKNN